VLPYHGRHRIPVQRDVPNDGVRITPHTLDWMIERQSFTPNRLEQHVNGLTRESRCERMIAPISDPFVQCQRPAARDCVFHFGDISLNQQLGRVGQCARFRDTRLNGIELAYVDSCTSDCTARYARTAVFGKLFYRAESRAEQRRYQADRKRRQEWNAAWKRARCRDTHGEAAMSGYKSGLRNHD